jgi:hypothetical protein
LSDVAVAVVVVFWVCLFLDIATKQKVCAEITAGDKVLETQSMGTVMSMWEWSFLLSPAISGAIVKPTQQYPAFWNGLEHTPLYKFWTSIHFSRPMPWGHFCV